MKNIFIIYCEKSPELTWWTNLFEWIYPNNRCEDDQNIPCSSTLLWSNSARLASSSSASLCFSSSQPPWRYWWSRLGYAPRIAAPRLLHTAAKKLNRVERAGESWRILGQTLNVFFWWIRIRQGLVVMGCFIAGSRRNCGEDTFRNRIFCAWYFSDQANERTDAEFKDWIINE